MGNGYIERNMENEAAQIVPIQPTTTVDPNAAPADQGTPTTPAGLSDSQQGGSTPVPGPNLGSPGPSSIPDTGSTQSENPSDATPEPVSQPESTGLSAAGGDGNVSSSVPPLSAVLPISTPPIDQTVSTSPVAGGSTEVPESTPAVIPATAKRDTAKPRTTTKPRTFFRKTETPANVPPTGGASDRGGFWRRLRPAHYIAGIIVVIALGAGIFVSTPTQVVAPTVPTPTVSPTASPSATLVPSPIASPTLVPRRVIYYPTTGVTPTVLPVHPQPSLTP